MNTPISPRAPVSPEFAQLQHELVQVEFTSRFSDEQIEAIYVNAYGLYARGLYEKAYGMFLVLGVYRPLDARFTEAGAVCCKHMKDYEQAAQLFARTAQLEPGNADAPFQLVECLLLQKNRPQALEMLALIEPAAHMRGDAATAQRARAMVSLLEAIPS